MRPTRSVPGGCVVALFGLGAFVYAGLALAAVWMSRKKDVQLDQLPFLLVTGSLAAITGVALVWIGFRLAIQVKGPYDPADPSEPRAKF
jgi:uncharacterized membrane protein